MMAHRRTMVAVSALAAIVAATACGAEGVGSTGSEGAGAANGGAPGDDFGQDPFDGLGSDPSSGGDYGLLPYRPGVLTLVR